ncbi:sulfatase-like hydrolase/transferase [Crateriforma spongiae]|uniref:sulfatase-like hydrolase/transferase n=1 Tax=Crateriforma spongiae TaxID=2724528 RepID=UPI0014483CB2|nr:sulfatase-like hydrolase/transferase [Crateriforma spongiae]
MRNIILVASCVLCLAAVATADDRPNIMIILADDLGYGDISLHGCTDIPTPNIDSIAHQGARFTNGYSSHPYCSPMRAGLMTGRYQHRFGYTKNVAYDPHNAVLGLPTTQTTIAQRLHDAGYATGMVGKWHLGAHANFHPRNRGFDDFFGFLGGGHDYFVVDTTRPLRENYQAPLDKNGIGTGLDQYLTTELTDHALKFIDDHADHPFFMYVAYNAPHTPLQAPDEKLEQFASITAKKRRTYAAMVSSMDDQIGRLLRRLDQHDLSENTLVFFLSDNGGPENANASDNGPLRGQKGDVHEGGIRVPFLMRYPAAIQPGTVIDTPVISLDVSTTALAVADADQDATLDGVNLIDRLTGKVPFDSQRELFWLSATNPKTGKMAVRRGAIKLSRFDGKAHLYNLDDDLGETNDLFEQDTTTAQSLNHAFGLWSSQNQPTIFPSYSTYHRLLKEFHESVKASTMQSEPPPSEMIDP